MLRAMFAILFGQGILDALSPKGRAMDLLDKDSLHVGVGYLNRRNRSSFLGVPELPNWSISGVVGKASPIKRNSVPWFADS